MLEALTYQEMLRNIIENSERYGIEDDTIGILFTRPNLETGEAILSSLVIIIFALEKLLISICLDMVHIGMERIRMKKW